MVKPLRIAFMGTPDFVLPTIQSLIDGPHDLVCIYTQPPREKGRHKKLEKTPAHELAEETEIEVRHPVNFKSQNDLDDFKALNLDVAIVAAYGMLLPEGILNAPKFGCINIHPSLLPKWRGPSPVQYAIWKGDKKTGVTVMYLEKSMDTGPIIAQDEEDITSDTNFISLNKILWEKGTSLLAKTLDDIAKTGALNSTPQNHDAATYCKLLNKEQGRIDFTQTAVEIDRQVRGLNPWPGTWCLDSAGKRLKILETKVIDNSTSQPCGTILSNGSVACGDGTILALSLIQPENKKPMNIKDALNGSYIKDGDILT